jgi:hypothetical protein
MPVQITLDQFRDVALRLLVEHLQTLDAVYGLNLFL